MNALSKTMAHEFVGLPREKNNANSCWRMGQAMSKAADDRRWIRRGEKLFAAMTRAEREDILTEHDWKRYARLLRREGKRWWFFKTTRGWVGNRH